ncbi:NAD(P)-dependent oxidoreductase [Phocicoccus pinnipedialis]|uniref:D-3-phosphoglycerate dehydrogenase n=1 Tax=Phocicoccus pinnipedialis TaxID=110845 RepID=A0A6V7RFM2_9BACL|nr:NAD(P)-dependent oxidoreductase [Jeotgalicoccus pinnipedialis]MBP1939151.1 D-3-phosphoglycerate dehydrogenase [Jeotgalicoccus pinnipedialis]CAD2076567.1 D-3-phosphoglycerate dehydrogenase [Jeotgalicoccus pinnipedialis]
MLVKLLEPLNVSEEVIEKLAQPIKEKGHDFVYYNTKTTDEDELVERSKDADVIMIANNPYPLKAIESNKNLKLINVAFTGVDHVEIKEASNQDIIISNAAGYANTAVAELAVGLTLDVFRKISQGDEDTRKSHDFPGAIQGREIKGKTVGLIGTGKIGVETAALFKAFGAELIAADSSSENPDALDLGVKYLPFQDVIKKADILTLHVPLTDSTRHLIGKDQFAEMKEDAIIINCARGAVIDNDALAEALNKGEIAGAGIDVYDMEPPIPSDYKLLNAKNTVLTPHIGFLTNEAMELRAEIAFQNTLNFLEGKPSNVVKR